MTEFELVRQMISLGMLSVASYSDIKRRKVSDYVWIFSGVAGALLYLIEPANPVVILYLAIGIAIWTVGLASRTFGQADCLALIALSITMPTIDGLPVGVVIPLLTVVFASVYSLSYNVAYNLSDLLHGRLYDGICESPYRKIIAFLVLHRKRTHEKFVFRAQHSNKFVFHFRSKERLEFAYDFQGHVVSATPLIPFMLLSTILVLVF